MKDKYYTPTIDEFHVGFEYEILEMGCKTKYNPTTLNQWDDLSGDYDDSTLLYEIARGRQLVRVKYLDREDIESLGFVFIASDWWHKSNMGDDWQITRGNKDVYLISYGQHEYVDKSKGSFKGKIKNKSELKRLLKQLGI